MKLAIVGSVSLMGNTKASRIIHDVLDFHKPSLVISGGAVGIDKMAVQAAMAQGIDWQEFLPEKRRWWGRGGFMERNLEIAKACDRLVRIVSKDSKTYGSGWTRDRAVEMGKPTEEFVV